MKRQTTLEALSDAIRALAVVIWPAKAWDTVGSTKGPYRVCAFTVDTERKPIPATKRQLLLPFGQRAPWVARLHGRRLRIEVAGRSEKAALRSLLCEVARRVDG